MNEENNTYMSEHKIALTLEPTDVPKAQGIEMVNTLKTQENLKKSEEEAVAQKLDESTLTVEERKLVDDFSKQIDITDTNQILMYGSGAQKNVSAFSENALERVKTQDLGEIGGLLTNLVVELKGFSLDAEKPRGISGFFRKAGNQLTRIQSMHASAEINVDKIADVLQGHQIRLLKDIAMLDRMYEVNLDYFRELTMYILAGKKRLNYVRENDLPKAMEKARQSGRPEDAQSANDLAAMCTRFEKKLHDLELTRVISMQMAPQIRLIQNNDSMMVEKIQSSLVNTIPLWKNQMVLSIGLANSQQALDAQRAVTDVTNDLLRHNADVLKQGTIQVARESERAIVDIETLKHTNEQLISTLDEVIQIQYDGRQKRLEAENEMARIEGELKTKLLELKK